MKIGIKTYTDAIGYEYLRKIASFVDFVEILPLPDDEVYKNFADFDIPFRIHAPHQGQGSNPSDKSAHKRTLKCMEVAMKAADLFDSPTIVVHPGAYKAPGSLQTAIDFLKKYKDKRFLIENLPAESEKRSELCSTAEDMARIIKELGCGICLDFGHATLTETATGQNYKEIIDGFLKLKPKYFHIMGGSLRERVDHKELFWGDFDIAYFRRCIPENSVVVLETPHEPAMQIKEIEFLKTGKRI
ncbi:MAG: sugar phosphate isomerase/epimerase [Nanoarchaeota archaeon]|nr:sugar phosphate isomerase/epimerase [Nanoarchaeota archaeon]